MAKYKVGDKVRVREDLIIGKVYGGYTFTISMGEHRGNTCEIKKIYNHIYDLGNCFSWTNEMLEEVKEDKMEKTFREVIADIKEGEVWESNFAIISYGGSGVEIKFKYGTYSEYCFCDGVMFRLQRKEYTFEEAFKAYEEGREIEDYNKVKYKKINGVDHYKFEWDKDFCTRAHEDDYWLGFKEIRGKWYIND